MRLDAPSVVFNDCDDYDSFDHPMGCDYYVCGNDFDRR